jgi:hypothetical protein
VCFLLIYQRYIILFLKFVYIKKHNKTLPLGENDITEGGFMDQQDPITSFYKEALPKAALKNNTLSAPCPFCRENGREETGILVVFLNPDSYFHGYFRCLNRCSGGGFPLEFGRRMRLDLSRVPGFDPDREYTPLRVDYPLKNLNRELGSFMDRLTDELINRFTDMGIGLSTLREMKIGYNGRYLVYPYFQQDGNCYSAHCIHPDRPDDDFWYGDEDFFHGPSRIFNSMEIKRCENGSLIIVEGEDNLLALRQLGLPAIALPTAADFSLLTAEQSAWIRTLFVWSNHTPESESAAREFAARVGYKVRIIRWPESADKDYNICRLARDRGDDFQKSVLSLIRSARSFSPFSSPQREYLLFQEQLAGRTGEDYRAMTSGFPRLDRALGGLHGINIMGGLPKAGKSCFFIQIASELAGRRVPVIYYDFENGRRKIYLRILARLSRLTTDQIVNRSFPDTKQRKFAEAQADFQAMLPRLRVVSDRRLTPTLMRSHIDFLRHETKTDSILIVIDSLHKLPFKDLSERRTGIDAWLRQFEAIRDELGVSFLIISELTRSPDGSYDSKPQLGAFKGSGDIEYSADNAMVLLPQWDPFDENPIAERHNDLWLVASREHSPGRIASYRLDYPYWGFVEEEE